MGLFSILGNKNSRAVKNQLTVDMHSHLIFDVDDGAQSLDESLFLIKNLHALGYEKLITTPHIMTDFYENSKDNLLPKRDIIREALIKENINIGFELAAEYYLDDGFEKKIADKSNLLLINNKYILVETSYLNQPNNLNTLIFEIQSSGITPILAHPERYAYMYDDFEKYEELFEKGVLFQININSLSGYYSKGAQKTAQKLIEKEMVHFAGSDCHAEKHINALHKSMLTKDFQNLQQLPLLNNSLA